MPQGELHFADRFTEVTRTGRLLTRVAVILILIAITAGLWSGYRAWFQVRELDVNVMSQNVRPGIPVVVRVVTSGRAPVDVQLELVQGTDSAMLANLRVSANPKGTWD